MKFKSTLNTIDYPWFVLPTRNHIDSVLYFIERNSEPTDVEFFSKYLTGYKIHACDYKHKFAVNVSLLDKVSFGVDNYNEENNKYHLDMTNDVEKEGFQLFHIFENEWANPTKRKIWESMILGKMNKHTRIYARQCQVREITYKESNDFLNENHMQGSSISGIQFALFYNEEIVAVMTFGLARMSKKFQYELLRFASKLNTTVVGAGSKLLKAFERKYNPKSLVSYANRRWSTGNFYKVIGFAELHISEPNYFYYQPNIYPENCILYSRNKFQKHKLSKELTIFDPKETEVFNCYINGYRRIHDSGNIVYTKIY